MLLNVAHRERAAPGAVGARAGRGRRGREPLRLHGRRAGPRPPRPRCAPALRAGGRVEILEGLRPGQRVVTEGVVKVADGMEVRLAGARNAQRGRPGQGGGQPAGPDSACSSPTSRSGGRSSRRWSRCWSRWSAWSASSASRCANIPTSIRRSSRSRPAISAPPPTSSRPGSPRCSRSSSPASRGCRRSPRARRTASSEITHRVRRRPRRSIPPPTTCATGSAPRPASCPIEVEPPVVRKVDADASPIMFLVVSKPGWSRLELSDWVDRNLVDRFSSIDGVARVFVGGEARPAMRVWMQPERLAAFGLTPADVENALRRQNVELPAGRLESAQQNVTLRVEPAVPDRARNSPSSSSAAAATAIWSGSATSPGSSRGRKIPIRAFRLNGKPAVGLGIVRQSGANTLAVAEAAKAMAEQVRPTLPAGHGDRRRVGRFAVHRAAPSRRSGRRSPRRRCWSSWSSICSSAAGARR